MSVVTCKCYSIMRHPDEEDVHSVISFWLYLKFLGIPKHELCVKGRKPNKTKQNKTKMELVSIAVLKTFLNAVLEWPKILHVKFLTGCEVD